MSRKKRAGTQRGIEFSKLLILMECSASALLVIAVVVVALRGGDITILSALAGGSTLVNGTISAFYLEKAKRENKAKYAQLFVAQLAEKYGFDNAMRIAEFVIEK